MEQINKFQIGDKVVVVKLDEELCGEPYDSIGDIYACTHFSTGIITQCSKIGYTVKFSDTGYMDEFYYKDHQLMSLKEYNKSDKKAIQTLYGRK